MALPVQNTILTNTFQFLLNRVNDLANNMSLWTVTTDGNSSWTTPAGNASITGTWNGNNMFLGNSSGNVVVFGYSSTISANTIATNNFTSKTSNVSTSVWVGSSTTNVVINTTAISISNTTSNIQITSPNTVQYSSGSYWLNANGSYVLIPSSIVNQASTTGTSTQVIDSWLFSTYRAAEYLVEVNDLVNNNHVVSKMLMIYDGSSGWLTEFGTIVTNTVIGWFTVSTNTSSMILNYTPVSTSTSVRYVRTLVT